MISNFLYKQATFFSRALSVPELFSSIKKDLNTCKLLETFLEVITSLGVTTFLRVIALKTIFLIGLVIFFYSGASVKGVCIEDSFVKVLWIKSIYVNSIFVGVACNKSFCVRSASIGKHSRIHLQSFLILKVKLFRTKLENGVRAG